MTTILVTTALLLIGLGMLLGSSWTQQALQARYRKYAAERRALNEEWRTVRELRAQLAEQVRRPRGGRTAPGRG